MLLDLSSTPSLKLRISEIISHNVSSAFLGVTMAWVAGVGGTVPPQPLAELATCFPRASASCRRLVVQLYHGFVVRRFGHGVIKSQAGARVTMSWSALMQAPFPGTSLIVLAGGGTGQRRFVAGYDAASTTLTLDGAAQDKGEPMPAFFWM